MKIKSILWMAPMILCAVIQAQTPVTVKSSPAADALVHAAQDLTTQQKAYDTALNQARSSMDASNKQLQQKLQDKQKALVDQLKADKKYKDQMAEIDTLTKQLQSLNADASTKFNAQIAPIQNEIGKDQALIGGLISIVRKENGLPESATFDTSTQTWKSAPASPPPPAKK